MSINAFIEESAKEILREKIPGQGKVFIESLDEVDVAGFAKAQVSAADTIIPDNIKNGEIILGVQGTYDSESSLVYEKDTDGSTVDFNLRDAQTDEIIEVGSRLEIGHEYWITPVLSNMCNFYVSGIYVGTDEWVYFRLTEEMVIDNKVIIKVVNA